MKHVVFVALVVVGLGLLLPLVRSLVQVSWVRVRREKTLHAVSGYTVPDATSHNRDIR